MMFNVSEGRLKLQDTEMDYITFGKGARPMIMIQGLNTRGIKGAGLMLAYMYRIFARDYKVYLFDRRVNIPDGITVRDMARDVAAAMDALKLTNADILGVSQGGMIGQYLAIDRPDLVNKLVLAVTLSRNNDTAGGVIDSWIKMMKAGDMKGFVTDMAVKMYSREYVKRYKLFMPLLTIMQKPRDIERFTILAKACLTCDAYEELEKIKCPVFVIGGSEDQVVGAKASEEIAEKLGCRIHMYEDLGHAAYEEAEDFNKRVYDFLKE